MAQTNAKSEPLKRKIIKRFTQKSIFTGKPHKYVYVKIYNEPQNVRGVKFTMDTIVQADAKYPFGDSVEPINDPNYNIRHAIDIARRKLQMLSPKEIVHSRKAMHLSVRDVAAITGLSYSTLSFIENDDKLQSIGEDTILHFLTRPAAMAKLAQSHLRIIKQYHPKRLTKIKLFIKRIQKEDRKNG